MQREKIVDIEKCYKKQIEIMSRNTGIETDLCGKCFAVCAYTQRYLKDAALQTDTKNKSISIPKKTGW